MKPKVLYLATAYPFGIGGGCFANHAYLKSFSDLFDGNIDVLFCSEWDKNRGDSVKVCKIFSISQRPVVRKILSAFTGDITRFSKPAFKIINENAPGYRYVVSNGSSIGGYVSKIANERGIIMVTIHHNYEPEYIKGNTKGGEKFLYQLWTERLEKKAYLNSDINLFLTEQDKVKFESVYGKCKGKCAVLGVFEYAEYQEPVIKDKNKDELTFVITGSLDTIQGVDGIRYFFDELYQYLPEDCHVIIAGHSPAKEVISHCKEHKNVILIPNPEDMTSVISSGDIYICPTRVGGGLKLRVMDGLRLGLPVITHSCSARGYDAFYGTDYFKSFDTQEEFKDAVDSIVSKVDSIKKSEVVNLYKKVFSYKAGLARMKKLIFD